MIVSVIVRAIKEKVYAETPEDLQTGTHVIVETDHGVEAGVVYEREHNLPKSKNKIMVGKILRKITQEDLDKITENQAKQKKAFEIVLEKVSYHNLDMKLTRVQYTLDRSKLFVYYTSESRVDFRELIKDLGHALKTRIQMVQIGVRDESKMIGGIGVCGRQLCCQIFLRDFNSVTIDMAKDQDLLLNIAKLSGVCGRLMCCISYESQYYRQIKEGLPNLGEIISTPNGKGKFCALDPLKQTVTVEMMINNSKEFKKFKVDEIKELNKDLAAKNLTEAPPEPAPQGEPTDE
ncbi:MAG: stage 0 sporulation protein [Elusimicrobiota bacterium]|jgi:cell fate regulator YaaT (PSP1 superfamily)|nr:stage 0 sporulation protein [Elusimicrobiota bacterium]